MPLNMVHDADGLPRILLTDPTGSSAEVLLYGGQVVSWKNERREELLFMSSKQAIWKPPKAIGGGIPVCFQQLGNLGSLERHGFARNKLWSLDNDPSPLPPTNNQSSVDLILKSTEEDRKTWPKSFELRLRITLSASKLTLISRVRNTDNRPFSFTFALRNYLSVSDISEVRVEGLETLDYLDNLMHKERFTEQADAITFDGEVDRVYLSTPSKIAIIDHEKKGSPIPINMPKKLFKKTPSKTDIDPIKMQKKLFKKTLSKTDIDYRMAIPMDSLSAFQIPEGEKSKEVVAVDIDGHRWSFKCTTRSKDPHPKPVLSSGWIRFVKNRGLKEGDEVIFSVAHNDGAEGLQFGIEARKKLTKLFGQDIWSNPL